MRVRLISPRPVVSRPRPDEDFLATLTPSCSDKEGIFLCHEVVAVIAFASQCVYVNATVRNLQFSRCSVRLAQSDALSADGVLHRLVFELGKPCSGCQPTC